MEVIKEIFFVVLQVCFITQLYFLIANHRRLASYKPSGDAPVSNLPISVIISARNEHDNLKNNLPIILDQDYPDYEVVVVNDCSSDMSDYLLLEYEKQYPKLKVVTVTEHPRFKTGKKFALTMGIKAAKNEHLLFTDADCEPVSGRWIARMADKFKGKTAIVLGYSPYKRQRGLLNLFIRFETLKTAINYLSAALNGEAYMGIGRNMAYTKTLFFANKGFAAHMHVMAGDDDLFVNQNATSQNVDIEIHRDAHILSSPKETFRSYYRQKKRHMGVGKLYKNKHRRFLSFDAISGFVFYALLIYLAVVSYLPWMLLGVFMFRLIFQVAIYNNIYKKLSCADLIWYLPFFDIIYYIYLNLFGLLGTFTKTKQWK
ncbi:cellulose synthase/poly-beta-1,6-N-acetylglucosamine synthase-like glycosyltransferase [Mucilaginibacter gracilis]|uniref:Cellulose synthase/poly-beta-1,6-N-acetylglucosamine synthase-like glycosyltransferase n=1 Tax=Mucilaginibacter gracilis TaxID=423350 RepID=A0A495J8C2_9SPHI|nr:glycosyltransferase [Mucilaginibacter gracilis]RKR85240.1 cellulose synthase/poly-beta-1,6-N-acetylglucosamine synthase-like glycosyltransferase [Mucilaginibacter gracilis]